MASYIMYPQTSQGYTSITYYNNITFIQHGVNCGCVLPNKTTCFSKKPETTYNGWYQQWKSGKLWWK